jgi:hypothetical protein
MRFRSHAQRKKVMSLYKVRFGKHYLYTIYGKEYKPGTEHFIPPFRVERVTSVSVVKHPTIWQKIDAIGGY